MSRIVSLLFFCCCLASFAFCQDTIILINGNKRTISSYELSGDKILYFKKASDHRKRSMNPERVYSIRSGNGSERIIYRQDTLDPYDFTKEEMRLFILGEQDAGKNHKNMLVKGSAFVIGGASGLLGFYGILVPPLYSTVLGAFSPNMKNQAVSDPALLGMNPYREGYERKVRDRKIRNSMLSGMLGLVSGIIAFNIIYHN